MTFSRLLLTSLLAASLAAPGGALESLSFRSWRARAERQEREKDLAAAESSWSNALSSWRESDGKPGRAKAYCARAALREKNGESAGARADYSECLALDKKNAKAFHRRGALLLEDGKRVEAMSDFYRAIALDIRFAAAYHDRARAYEDSGESLFAQEDYKRACDLGFAQSCSKLPRRNTPAPRAARAPRFADCRASLEACLDAGGAYGSCVAERPRCGDAPVKGCCPSACVRAFGKAAALSSEADSYRQHFSADAACAATPSAVK